MTSRVVILGGDGIGLIVAETIAALRSLGHDVLTLGFLNDLSEVGDSVNGVPVLGRFVDWPFVASDACFVAAFPKSKQAWQRHQRLRALGIPDERWATVCHPSAQIAAGARIERGCYVAANAVVEPGAEVGPHTIVRAGAYLSHDVQLGEFAFVGPNATLLGRSRYGDGVHVGGNSVTRERVTVGEYAVIGIGSVLIRDVEPFAIVAGNPARPVGSVGLPR